MALYRGKVPWLKRLHQGTGRRGLVRKVDRLLGEFDFGPLEEVLAPLLEQLGARPGEPASAG